MASAKIRKGDLVMILSGRHRPQKVGDKLDIRTGLVLRVIPDENKALVEKLNYVWKHKRKSQKYPKGARVQIEAPIHLSKLKLICRACNRLTNVRFQVTAEGDKVRICRKCGKPIIGE